MTDIRDVIDSLREEIEAGKRDIEAKESALRLLESRFGLTHKGPASSAPNSQGESRGANDDLFDLATLVIDDSARKRTFVDELRDVLQRFGPQEFGIGHVEAALKQLGIEVAGKTPRSRISANLSKLNDEAFLVKTFEGGGNVPHRYRVRSSMTEDEIKNHESAKKADAPVTNDGPDDGEL